MNELPARARGTCRSCGAPILWAKGDSNAGKANPIDPEPVENGNIALTFPQHAYEELRARYLRKGDVRTPPLYVSHFATCPNAKGHRR